MLAITLIAASGLAWAFHVFVQVLDDELLNQTLSRELDSLEAEYRQGVSIAGPRGRHGHVYVVRAGQPTDNLPPALSRFEGDGHRVVQYRGEEYDAGRRRIDDATLYFMLNTEAVEVLEGRLAVIGWFTLLLAVIAAVVLSIGFAYLILRPVRAIADRLARYHPGQRDAPIADEYGDRDMHLIAASFDALIGRFHAFIEREQAFTEDAGHELRTPLAIALSTNELLLADPGISAKTRERAERTHAACTRMKRLVAALLFLARGRGDGGELGGCDVAQVLEEVLSYYADSVAAKAIDLRVASFPTPVAAPPGIVDCVLHNLVENAVEHSAGGRIDVEVDPHRIEIADTGVGIDADALEHIFDRRYRSAQSRGLGIGLYLVDQICQRLGWTIKVDSHASRGTRFTIDLNDRLQHFAD